MHLYISNSGEQPIYEQITSQIKNHILSGELTPGEALPSLRLLAKELRVSIISTKRAYEELERGASSSRFRERAASSPRRISSSSARRSCARRRSGCGRRWTSPDPPASRLKN